MGLLFQSQQSGEKALKACLYEKGYTSEALAKVVIPVKAGIQCF
jgi:hypothetical protein